MRRPESPVVVNGRQRGALKDGLGLFGLDVASGGHDQTIERCVVSRAVSENHAGGLLGNTWADTLAPQAAVGTQQQRCHRPPRVRSSASHLTENSQSLRTLILAPREILRITDFCTFPDRITS